MRQFMRTRRLEAELENVAPRIRPSDLPRLRPLPQAQVPPSGSSLSSAAATGPSVTGS
ncbi:MAG: hypothetical protein IT198_12060 [Acidimicrobiia bacterium]|nr:hypothetical protein [Acidimicrobiia bacterium]